jgi:hypothetical protein
VVAVQMVIAGVALTIWNAPVYAQT